MTTSTSLACGHGAARVEDYDEGYRWVVRCRRCGLRERWSQREWRARRASLFALAAPPVAVAEDGPAESGRVARGG